jgi:paraquat-inducible protein A
MIVRARDLHLLACPNCGVLCRNSRQLSRLACPRCGSALHLRKPNSLGRTRALLIAAITLYVPANVLPVMETGTLLSSVESHTILGGVIELWNDGAWYLAAIVFIASVVVPILKIVALGLLAVGVQRGWSSRLRQRAALYRMVEAVGHWSMLDVYVIAVLVALVHFRGLAEVIPGPGITAFGLVVVLTIWASASFDPRLTYDAGLRHG